MAERSVARKLAAIVFSDVAGFSRLVELDDAGTMAMMNAHRTESWDPTISLYGGRVVGTAGDGQLTEFASTVAAVEAAVAIQRGMIERNSGVPEARRIRLRIGINIGEVIEERGDIFGEGVNIAARIGVLCRPDEIALSEDAYRLVAGKIEVKFIDDGEHRLKNISRPIRVWRWADNRTIAGVSAPSIAGPLPLPRKPSIAVLPFDNLTGDEQQAFFARGIAEDVAIALSRFRHLFVISPYTSFAYKDGAHDTHQIAREFGVRYLLRGSVRRGGGQMRINALLLDAPNGGNLWSDHFECANEELFAVQDRITEKIVIAVAPEVQDAEIERSRTKPNRDLGAWEMVARANWQISQFSAPIFAEAEVALTEAMRSYPDNSAILAALARCYGFDCYFGWQRPQAESLVLAADAAGKAIALDDRDESAHTTLGMVHFMSGRNALAIDQLKHAIVLNPNYSQAIGGMGITLTYSGAPERAVEALNRAIRLSPRDPMRFLYITQLGMLEYLAGRYDEAVDWKIKAIQANPNYPGLYRALAATHAMRGDLANARAALEKFNRLAPGATISTTLQMIPFAVQADAQRYAEGLRRAGMPE